MFLSWIKAAQARDAAKVATPAPQAMRDEWTGEAWRDHRAQFKAHLAQVAASEGVRLR
jgi:hypothetical protein